MLVYKKAMLSQRWPRDAPYGPIAYMGALKIFGSPCMATPTANFPDIFNGLLFQSIPWLCIQNLKFVPLPAPEIGLSVIDCRVLGGGCKAQSSGREGWWELMSSYRQWLFLYLYAFQKFRDCAAFVLLHTTFPSDSPLVSSDFPHIPLEVRRWPFGYEEWRCWPNCPCN